MRSILDLVCNELNISDHIKETAFKIFSIAKEKKLLRGRSNNGFIAASLYIAIKIHKFPILYEEIIDLLMIPRRTLLRSIMILETEVISELNFNYKLDITSDISYFFLNVNKSGSPIKRIKYLLEKFE